MKKCTCILSGHAQTTNYCPLHKNIIVESVKLDNGSTAVFTYPELLIDTERKWTGGKCYERLFALELFGFKVEFWRKK